MREILAAARADGGAVRGEHGIGSAKAGHLLALADPAVVTLMRRIEEAFGPRGIPNPAVLFGPAGD